MPDTSLLIRAADCYRRAGLLQDEARCFRIGGLHLRAAQAWVALEAFAEAARDYAAAGAHQDAAWVLVHYLGDIAEARRELDAAEAAAAAEAVAPETAPSNATVSSSAAVPTSATAGNPTVAQKALQVRLRLIRARCDAAEGIDRAESADALHAAMDHLEHDTQPLFPISTEQLAVAAAEAMGRPDLVALLFAAAVRGGRYQAAERWNAWSLRVLKAPLILPEPGTDHVVLDDSTADVGQADARSALI